jgi:hypothetical protein
VKEERQAMADSVNLQWEDTGKAISSLGDWVAMIDTSGSMTADNMQPLLAAIGLGCRIAEKSKLGRRAMTFSSRPSWVNLEDCTSLTEMAAKVHSLGYCGMNTNFHAAMKLILDACIEKDLSPEEVGQIVFAVFSDMQIDAADTSAKSMHHLIADMFAEGGKRTSHGRPYPTPSMLYWNLRSTGGFPSLSSNKNVSMLSGFSPILLNTFCEKGIDALKECTPWHMLVEQLDGERYAWASKKWIGKEIETSTITLKVEGTSIPAEPSTLSDDVVHIDSVESDSGGDTAPATAQAQSKKWGGWWS